MALQEALKGNRKGRPSNVIRAKGAAGKRTPDPAKKGLRVRSGKGK